MGYERGWPGKKNLPDYRTGRGDFAWMGHYPAKEEGVSRTVPETLPEPLYKRSENQKEVILCVVNLNGGIIHPWGISFRVDAVRLTAIVILSPKKKKKCWRDTKEVFEAQTLANLFRFPMIFLSGVFIPIVTLPLPVQIISYFLPLTYSVESLRKSLLPSHNAITYWVSVLILAAFSIALFWMSVRVLKKRLG